MPSLTKREVSDEVLQGVAVQAYQNELAAAKMEKTLQCLPSPIPRHMSDKACLSSSHAWNGSKGNNGRL